MKKLIFLLILMLTPQQVSAERGIVIKEDVCGTGNVLIQVDGGMYIAAEYYSGVILFKGDKVFGKLKTYGFEEITNGDKESGTFFVQDCQSDNIGDAIKVLCD